MHMQYDLIGKGKLNFSLEMAFVYSKNNNKAKIYALTYMAVH